MSERTEIVRWGKIVANGGCTKRALAIMDRGR